MLTTYSAVASVASVASLLVGVADATILWDGRFNDMTSSADLNNWSWSNEVGPYQYYIHGPDAVTEYVNLSPDYKNPADSGSSQGAKLSLTSTSYWEGQTMRRTELIPQTTAAINAGTVYYHFSLMRSGTNPPATTNEHQIAFFESHFTEMKSGLISGEAGTTDAALRWDVNSVSQWSTTWDAGIWHNVAYEIDFAAGSVGFWHSTGGDDLAQVVAPMSVAASSDGEDWHVGALELPMSSMPSATEDFYFSGVYIESGSLTTSVSGPGGASSSSSSSSGVGSSSSSSPPKTSSSGPTTMLTTTAATTSKPATTVAPPPSSGGASEWAQCGGSGYAGPTYCVAGYTCSTMNPYYAQCL